MSHSEQLSNFQAISGASEKEAKNWLEKSRWNLEEALSRFFDAGGATNIDSAAIEDAEAKQRRVEKKDRLVSRLQEKVREQVELDELVNPSVGIKIKSAGGPAELLPLRGAKIQAQVRDICADISLEMRFINDTPNAVEAVFRLAVDQGVIYHFEAETSDGKKVTADVKEKEDAFYTYDDAIASGHGAFLVEKTKEIRDAFQITLGNMLPNREVIVTVKYTTTLETEGDALRLVLPVTRTNLAGTRRVVDLEEDDDLLVQEVMDEAAGAGAAAAGGKKKEDKATTSVEFAKKVPDGLNVNVDVEMSSRGLKIARIESPSHTRDMKASVNKSKANVSFTNAQVAKLMEVLIFLENATANTCTLEVFDRDGKAAASSSKPKEVPHAAVVSFCPKIETAQEPAVEAIFLVDRSGSMAGSFMNQAKNALQIFLRSLPLGTKFNIVSFGTSYSALFHQATVYTEDTMRQAERHVDEMTANMIGTNLLQPMQFVLSAPVDAKCPRQIFLLTDGSVDNTSAVLSLVRQSVGDNQRIFTLGVGSDAGRALVAGIARFGRGKAEFVRSGQRLEAPVMRHIKRALQPALSDVEVEWGSAELGDKFEVVPTNADPHFPPVFDGERLTLSTFFKSSVLVGSEDEKTVVPLKISGRMRDEKFSFTVDLNLKWLKNGSAAHRITANAAINLMQRNKGHETRKADIVDLAITYGIASKFTSLVAVEERDGTAATGDMVRVDVNSKQQADVSGRVAILPEIEAQIARVREITHENLDMLMDRGEKLDELVLRTDTLQQQSQQFQKRSAAVAAEEPARSRASAESKKERKKSSGGLFSGLFGKKDKESARDQPQERAPPSMALMSESEDEEGVGSLNADDDAFAMPMEWEAKARSSPRAWEREESNFSGFAYAAGASAPPPPPAAAGPMGYASPAPLSAVPGYGAPARSSASRGGASQEKLSALRRREESDLLPTIGYNNQSFAKAAPVQPVSVPANNAMRPLDRFVRMIRAAGNFNLADISIVAEKSESVLRSVAPDSLSSVADRETTFSIWATALALVIFTTKFNDAKDEWETVAAKAKRWLTRAIEEAKVSVTVDALLEAAKKAL